MNPSYFFMKSWLFSPFLLPPTYHATATRREQEELLRQALIQHTTSFPFHRSPATVRRRAGNTPFHIRNNKKGGSFKMNDLFSHSFKKYQDVKVVQGPEVDPEDLEAGIPPRTEGVNLDKFFEDVEGVKKDMADVEKLYKQLQERNEESKTAHNAKTMKELRARMDSDVSQVLKRVKVIKGKLEALEKSNAAQRKVPGCGPGSSADRTRTSVVSGLGKKLKNMMDDFQGLRARMNEEYKETVGRRYFTVTGEKADDDMIESMISSGESETFLQKAIQEQGRGQIMDAISEIQERHDAVKEIEKNLLELHQIFLDMAALVEAQGQQLNDIESHVAHASSFVRRGTEQLQEARELQKGSRKWCCIGILLAIILIVLLTFPLWSHALLAQL